MVDGNANWRQWDYTEIQTLGGKMRAALKDKRNHAYYEV
jgi:hypothetical protein